jgi:hypothetical protein
MASRRICAYTVEQGNRASEKISPDDTPHKGIFVGEEHLNPWKTGSRQTSFLNYLKDGKLPNERSSISRTYKPYDARALTFDKQGEFEIKLKRGRDVPGQIEIKDQLE